MKNATITALIFALMQTSGLAQSSESEIAKEFYRADANINLVLNYLPANWTFSARHDTFFIRSNDSVWILSENRINAKPEKKEDLIKRIQSKGIRTTPEILIRFEPRWNIDKLQMAKTNNAAIDEEISQLPAKYKITHLVDKSRSTKEQIYYSSNIESEKQKIAQYEKEKQTLLARRIPVPDFNSQKYSLFIISLRGNNDDNHVVYPDGPSRDIYSILTTFREICGK